MGALAIGGGKVIVRDNVPCIGCCGEVTDPPCDGTFENWCQNCWVESPAFYRVSVSGIQGTWLSCNGLFNGPFSGSCTIDLSYSSGASCLFFTITASSCTIEDEGANGRLDFGGFELSRTCDAETGLWRWRVRATLTARFAAGASCCGMEMRSELLTTEKCYPHLLTFPTMSQISNFPFGCVMSLTNGGAITITPLSTPA